MSLPRLKTITPATLFAAAFGLLGGLLGDAAVAQSAGDSAPRGERPRMIIESSALMVEMTEAIAERIGATGERAPDIRVNLTADSMRAFCAGTGVGHPDVLASSRRMRIHEYERCIDNGVVDIIEVKIGFAALVFVQRVQDEPMYLTLRTLYRALAAEVPDENGEFRANAGATWRDVESSLPATPIRVLIPLPGTGSHGVFDDLVMQGGCRKERAIKEITEAGERVRLCTTLRQDGTSVAMPSPFFRTLQPVLAGSPNGTIGILPYHVALSETARFRILPLEGEMPSPESITGDSYELSQPYYYYVKRAHMLPPDGSGVVAGLREFVIEAASEEAIGPGGYLTDLGIVPMLPEERAAAQRSALRLERFSR